MTDQTYHFELPTQNCPIIKVIGVGGGGSNAVGHMHQLGIKNVEFVVCNTDLQALKHSKVTKKLQIGAELTDGLGAGADPEKGRKCALENKEQIRDLLAQNTKMVFITAGMGGGTGTGAAPIIAQIANELEILTVGIVTIPFSFEGTKKVQRANQGIKELKDCCDTVIIIRNDKLREAFGNLPLSEAFARANNVLAAAAKGISDIITSSGYVNVDFEDVRTVMKNAGPAVMGSAKVVGDNRAKRAAEEALNSPLLDHVSIYGAKNILLSIISGKDAELQMEELTEISNHIQEYAGDNAEIIFGHGIDHELGEAINVTLIATGFGDHQNNNQEESEVINYNEHKMIDLESEKLISATDRRENEPSNTLNEFVLDMYSNKSDEPQLKKKQDDRSESWSKDDFFRLKEDISKEIEEEDKTQNHQFELDFGNFSANKNTLEKEESNGRESQEQDGFILNESQKYIEENLNHARFEKERQEREAKFVGKSYEMNTDEFKEKLDTPAFKRKKVKLDPAADAYEPTISKLNLSEDENILGNNKFLHDNAD